MGTNLIKEAGFIFFDFDGVIKKSVEVKAKAFEKLFLPFGEQIAFKVKKHHEENGGMSRYEKFPIYLNFANINPTSELLSIYEKRFSEEVKMAVINSDWVEGILNYFNENFKRQTFFIVSATPQQEIEEILSELEIDIFFNEIIGSPTDKCLAVQSILESYNIIPENAILIGDSIKDFEAAERNRLSFILRQTKFNKKLQNSLTCVKINDFVDI